jgi:hypothetical protein
MKDKNKIDIIDVVGYVAIAVIVISLAFIGFKITGFAATDTAVVNVTITGTVSINFTIDVVDFGGGTVNGGSPGAMLYTNGTIVDGSWTPVSTPLVLENIGNVNASINLNSDKNADSFIGGASPLFKIKVSDTADNTGACQNNGATTYTEIGTSNITICNPLQYANTTDEIDINVQLYVPNDAIGAKTATLTAYATQV